MSNGYRSVYYTIQLHNFGALGLFSPFSEQTVIAETLSDMDAEITALEGMLSTAREVKAGMMSVLLTGKIRLNHD